MTIRMTLLTMLLLLLPGVARTQLVNGDFEDPDDSGWAADLPIGWTATFPDTGGQPGGSARIASPTPEGDDYGCLVQTFSCGEPGGANLCLVTVSYRHQNLGAESRTGGIEIRLDGEALHATPREENASGWRTVSVSAPCGPHTLALCLVRVDGVDVDGAPAYRSPTGGGIEGWEASFDNVTAACVPASGVAPTTWGRVKWLRSVSGPGSR